MHSEIGRAEMAAPGPKPMRNALDESTEASARFRLREPLSTSLGFRGLGVWGFRGLGVLGFVAWTFRVYLAILVGLGF